VKAKTARIEWVPQSQGGRRAPPVGPRYVAIAKLESAAESWPGEAWDLAIELIDRPRGPHEWIARVYFVFDDAPQEWLTEGEHFALYEGRRCVAHGEVQGEDEADRCGLTTEVGGRNIPRLDPPADFDYDDLM
jgi:hypothetical protein